MSGEIDKRIRVLRWAIYQVLENGIPQMSNRADREYFRKLLEDALNEEGPRERRDNGRRNSAA